MIIPWALVASIGVGMVVAAIVVRRAGQPAGPAFDLAAGVAIPALVAARFTGLAIDAATMGALPPIAALLTLGAGLSGAGAVLAGTVAGWRLFGRPARSHVSADLVRASVVAAAAGLAAWSLMAILRGDTLGLAAPVPLGVIWPGSDQPRLPVGLIDSVVLGGVAVWLARSMEVPATRLAARLALVMALMTVVGPLLRPSLATVDRDVEALLGVTAILVAGLLATGRARRLRQGVLPAAIGLAGTVIVVLAVGLGSDTGAAQTAAVPAGDVTDAATGPDIAGGMVPGGDPSVVPSWTGEEMRAYARAGTLPVVVNLWASWCPPCQAEAPALARAVRALGDQARVVGVLVDDDPRAGQAFVDRYDLPFPTVVDGGATRALGFAGLPTTAVLRPDGSIAHLQVGGIDPGALAAAIDRAG